MDNKNCVLVVDDSNANLILISDILESAGYSALSAISGKAALAILENNIPDLILLDVMMPGMSGFELCEIIKKDKDLKEIPLLFLTATSVLETKLKGFEIGAVDYISKPFQREELLARIGTHIALQEYKVKFEKTNEEYLKTKVRALESEKIFKTLFRNLPNAFALHKIVLDKNAIPIDYIFIEVNDAFEKLIGLTKKQIIGKKVTDIIPGIENESTGWIEKFGKVALTEETIRFESFLEGLSKWFSVVAFCPKDGFFATILDDLTEQKLEEKEKNKKSEEQRKLYEKSEKQRIANLVILNDFNKTTKDLKAEIIERTRSEQIQKVLYNISNATNITDNLKDLATQISKELGTIIDTTNFYIALYNEKTDIFSMPYFIDEKLDITSFSAGKSITNYVLKTKKSLLANKEKLKELIKTGDVDSFGIASEVWLGVPLNIAGISIGVIAVQSYTDENAYTESDREILEFVSAQISVSIERKRSEDKLIQHRDNLELTVNERTEKLKNTNYQLQAERDKAQRYLDIAEVIFLALDTNMNVTLINKKGCEVFGYSEVEMIGKNWCNFSKEETNNEERIEEFKKAIAEKRNTTQYNENHIIIKNGERRLIAWHDINILDNNGNVTGILSSGEDITERKELEDDLVRAKITADKANMAKSAFLANMSHEIRTPMNAIIGFSEILKKLVIDKVQKRYLDSIKSSGNTLLNIINDVLDISKIEAGKIEIKKEAVSLKIIIDELEQMFSIKTNEKGLSFNNIIDASLPEYVELDELRIRQVLLNLLSNAIKFTDTGYIAIELKALSQSKNSINLIINITDTGIGISENDQKKIFNSFQQTEDQDSRKYGGTGLGLSISKKIIELLGGNISVKSKIGKGSTFTIDIPNLEIIKNTNIVVAEKHKYKPEDLIFEKASVLVVDDIKDNRDVVKGFLSDYDFTISEAINGKQAVDMAEVQLPDLIFMDLRMPIMDGYKATQILKNNENTKHIPIIALTASAYINTTNELLLKGFDGYIRKPMHIIDLVNEISSFLKFKEIESLKPTIKDSGVDIPEALLDKLPEFIKGLELIKDEDWMNLKKRQTLKGVKQFSVQLTDLNKEFNLAFLNAYISNINDALKSFDIENIKGLVLEFPNLIEALKNRE